MLSRRKHMMLHWLLLPQSNVPSVLYKSFNGATLDYFGGSLSSVTLHDSYIYGNAMSETSQAWALFARLLH